MGAGARSPELYCPTKPREVDSGTLCPVRSPPPELAGTLPPPPDQSGQAATANVATILDKEGMLVHSRIIAKRSTGLEHGKLTNLNAVVVHQTDAPTAKSTLDGYKAGASIGAHFLIDKDGTIYQTASVYMRAYHVGEKIRSKCLTVDKKSCSSPDEMKKVLAMKWTQQIKALNELERAKDYPDRYPINSDSVGIELVGRHIDEKTFETVTKEQNASLKWLIGELFGHFKLDNDDVFRHPEVSYKNPGEAATAVWK